MSLILSGSDGVSDIDGSASTPAIRGTDTNTGIFFPAADTIAFAEGGAEAMRINSSGNVGIGTSSPSSRLDVRTSAAEIGRFSSSATNGGYQIFYPDNVTTPVYFGSQKAILATGNATDFAIVGTGANNMVFGTNGTERMRIDSSGNLLFNSGYGSVATAYGCRAWVNFDGTGTPAIRASGNVTSITDQGTGDYTVNITNAIVDANYSAVATAQRNNNGGTSWVGLYGGTSLVQTTTTVRVQNLNASQAFEDPKAFCVAIFR